MHLTLNTYILRYLYIRKKKFKLTILHNVIKFGNIGIINNNGHNSVNKDRLQVVASCITNNVKCFMLFVIASQFSSNRP